MKILHINSVCGIKSTGRICTDIAAILDKAGIESKIAYGREKVPDELCKYSIRIGNNIDVYSHTLAARFFDCAGFMSRKATTSFIHWMDEWKPDIIHMHNLHGYYINIELLFAYIKEKDIPVVWTLHDCWPITGHCTHFDFEGCYRWKQAKCDNCPLKRKYPSSYFLDNSQGNIIRKQKAFQNVRRMILVSPSQWLAGFIKESILNEYEVRVIPNGIDINIFRPIDSNFKKKYGLEGKKIVLAVSDGWKLPNRRRDMLLLSEKIDPEYKVVMVGFADDGDLKGLPKNIIPIKRTNSARELAEIYSAADVFVNPTYEDNYPTTNLEAQACGTPVISYKTGGSVESIPKENVVEKGDVMGLINAIYRIRKDEFHIPDMIDKQEKYKQYIDLYYEILKR